MLVTKEAVLLLKDKEPKGIVYRDDNGHRIFYSCEEMGDDDIIKLFDKEPAEDFSGATYIDGVSQR